MRLNGMRILLLTVLVLAAASATSPGAALATPQRSGIAHPTAPTKVVLRVSSGGGFVTPQTNLRALPSFTLYGDGTVITPGAITMIYPGPAVYPLVKSKLGERGVQALLQRARAAGLLVPRAFQNSKTYSVMVKQMLDYLAENVGGVKPVASGDALLAPSITLRLIDRFVRSGKDPHDRAVSLPELTQREEEVLRAVARGLSNAEIAESLVVSYSTVKTHVSHLLTKLDARDRAQLVMLAHQAGLAS